MSKLKIGKKSGLRYFGYKDIQSWSPCYDPIKHISKDWRGTAIDVLNMEQVPHQDRLWCVLRTEIVSERVMRLFAVWCARQVQHLVKDPRSIAALDVAERFANGEANEVERVTAWAAAWDAAWTAPWACVRDAAAAAAWAAGRDAAWDAAWDAAGAAARAAAGDSARAAARAAARDATWDATRAAQRAKLIEMLQAEAKVRKT